LGNKWSRIIEIFQFDPVPAARSIPRHNVALVGVGTRTRSTAATACTRHTIADSRGAISNAYSHNARRERSRANTQRHRPAVICSAAHIV
jgi:hypothetical protein